MINLVGYVNSKVRWYQNIKFSILFSLICVKKGVEVTQTRFISISILPFMLISLIQPIIFKNKLPFFR